MGVGSMDLLDILRIGHETSLRGGGISLREALSRTKYKERRSGFGAGDLRPVLAAHRELTEEWCAYSEDKRTSGGWFLLRSAVIGRVGDPDSQTRFDSMEEAVAEYVVQELDFWTGLEEAG